MTATGRRISAVLIEPGRYGANPDTGYRHSEQTVPAGRVVNSYFLHFDPGIREDQEVREVVVLLEFPTPIIGVIYSTEGLYRSDAVFGMEDFPPVPDKGLRGLDDELFEISEDRRKIGLRLRARRYVDQARILTEAVKEGG